MTRDEALQLLHSHMQSTNLRRHCYAVGGVMKALAKKLQGNENKWEVVGLLHDGDYESTKTVPSQHTLVMHKWLMEAGVNNQDILSAILSHNFAHTGQNAPKNNLEWALYCCDELTGLIIAVALIRPDKQLATVTVESIMKKWNQKAFAAGVKREQIAMCEEKLGIPLNEFIQSALSAMQEIHQDLGL